MFPTSLVAITAVLLLAALGRAWAFRWPAGFSRVTGPIRARWWRRRLRGEWAVLSERCGLADEDPPRVLSTAVRWPHVQFVARPVTGQSIQDFLGAAEALRSAAGAARLRVEPRDARDVLLTFTVADELRAPFPLHASADPELRWAEIGRVEDGTPWRLAVGPHTLVAGSSGAGKGSVLWSFAFALAPAVAEGRVQLHGIDLKGGMELLMGAALFTSTATNTREAVVSLERLVDLMQARTRAYAGRVRSHEATADEPLHVVMIDELAALTAYCPERDLQRRAEAAINLLCSQGRAPGFMVFACLQDPRKEVIPSRGLFTQMVGLRLKDLSETSMVLGETALESGAHCHRITRDVPGTGYVVPEDGSPPVRVRAGYADDETIRRVATEFATPVNVELVVPPPEDEEWAPRSRRSRVGGGLS